MRRLLVNPENRTRVRVDLGGIELPDGKAAVPSLDLEIDVLAGVPLDKAILVDAPASRVVAIVKLKGELVT